MTSKCPHCNCTTFVDLHSLYIKICGDCFRIIAWPLKKNQPALLAKKRDAVKLDHHQD